MNRLEMPIVTKETILAMEDMSFFTSALIFDNLLIVAQRETCCFVLKTKKELILIDAIWPDKRAFNAIIGAVKAVGWQPENFGKLVITHGHVDHTGCGKWFVDHYGVTTYLSEIDDLYWREHPVKPDRPETWKNFEIDHYLQDGEIIVSGDTIINVYATPGHTPGGLSYIFPVWENGVMHMAGLWGGTTPPCSKEAAKQYLRSLAYFKQQATIKHVDVALSNHTAIDNGLERIYYAQKQMAYMPNIYVIGEDGFQKFCHVFKAMGDKVMREHKSKEKEKKNK